MPSLKEQDELIDHIRGLYAAHRSAGAGNAVLAAFTEVQMQLDSHYSASTAPSASLLAPHCPSMPPLFQRLDVLRALREYEQTVRLSSRVYVPPTFSEVRSVLNLAVVRAAAPALRLLTLDADDTLYNDGGCLSFDAPTIPYLIRLLRLGTRVAVVTAAAYPGAPERYENRLAGLLSAMAFAIEAGAPPGPLVDNFFVMGGQCNYCLRARASAGRVYLEELPGKEWKRFRGVRWSPADVTATLDVAEGALRATAAKLQLSSAVLLIRKERAVGVIAKDNAAAPLSYEVLEELTLATQAALAALGSNAIPTSAFNGGHDVFVDVGSKALGLAALQGLLGASPESTVHVGDRFTSTGNDLRTRDCASTLWTASPSNTLQLLHRLVPLVAEARAAAAAAPAAVTAAGSAEGALQGSSEGSSPAPPAAASSSSPPSPATSSSSPVLAAAAAAAAAAAPPALGAPLILRPPLSIRGSLSHHQLSRSSSSASFVVAAPPSPTLSPRLAAGGGSGSGSGGAMHSVGLGAEESFGSDELAAEREKVGLRSMWLAAGGAIVPVTTEAHEGQPGAEAAEAAQSK